MLKTRLLTAIILIALVLWIIFFAPVIVFMVFVGLFVGAAAWEWAGLIPSLPKGGIIFRSVFLLCIEIIWIAFSFLSEGFHYFHYLLYFNAALLVLLIPALVTYPRTVRCWHSTLTVTILGVSFLVTAGTSLVFLKQMPDGNIWLICVLLLTWMTDTGAYFAGRFCGKRKFIPLVSPNKTWAGFWGGVLLSELVALIFGIEFATKTMDLGIWMMISTLIILGAIQGDLFISMLKRCVQVKDTGNLLPGHGGVLDRVDSLLVSAAVLAFFLIGVF
jgi:phosphatidate cytidylyltransferase